MVKKPTTIWFVILTIFKKIFTCIQFSWDIQYRGDGVLRDDITIISNLLIHIFDAREHVYIRIKLLRKFRACQYESFSVLSALFILKFSWRHIDPRTIHRMRRHFTYRGEFYTHLYTINVCKSSAYCCQFAKSTDYWESYNNCSTMLWFSIAFWSIVHHSRTRGNIRRASEMDGDTNYTINVA